MARFTNEVLVLNATSTLLTTTLRSRRSAEVQNLGPNPIYVSVETTTTAGTAAVVSKARRVAAGEAWAIELPQPLQLYAKAGTADQVTTAATIVTEIY